MQLGKSCLCRFLHELWDRNWREEEFNRFRRDRRFRGRENPELEQDDKANGPDTGQPSSETGQPTHVQGTETMKVSSSMGTGASLSAVDRRTLVDMTAPDFKAVTAQSPEDIDTEFGTPTRPLGSQETPSADAVTGHLGCCAPESSHGGGASNFR